MEESLGNLLIKAYNANERKNHYEVKKNINLALKILESVGIKLDNLKSDVDSALEAHT